MNLTEIRQKYPQYDNLSDEQLVIGLHKKYYPQMDFNDFAQRVGYRATPEQMPEFSPEALAQIEANNRAYDDKSHMGWNVIGDALSGAGEGVLSGTGRLASGLTFGASDWLDRKTGGNLAALDDRLQRRADASGVGTLNKVVKAGTEIVGNVAPSAAITRGLARAGVKSALGQAAAGGGVGGALYGATASDKLSDLPVNMLVGGVGGAAGGAALHSAISGIGTASGLLRSNVKKGMDYLRSKFGDAYVDDMIREAEQKGLSLAEVADNRALKAVQMARQQTSAADDIITQNAQAIKDNVPNKNTETLNDMFGTKSGYRMTQEAEQAAMDKARPMFNELEAYGDLDPLYVKPGEKVPTGKLSKEQADALLKQEMGKLPTEEDMPNEFRSRFSDINNLTGTISPKGEHFEIKYRTAESNLLDKEQHLLKDIESGKYDKLPSVKKQMENILSLIREDLSKLRGVKARSELVNQLNSGNYADTSSLGAVVNSNNVINNAVKSVKGAYSSLKGLPDTDARVILETRKLLSRQTKSPDATLAFQAKQALKEFDDALPTDFRKGLEEANKIYKDNYQFAEAQKSAKDIFNKEISPEEFSDKFGKMTAEEKRALRGGLRDEMFSIIENRANETLGWNRVVPKAVQSKIRRVMGVEEGNKLIEYAQGQLKSMRNLNKILGGSQTSEKQNLRDIASTGQRILDNPTGILGAVSRMIPWNNARNMGIARIMTNPSADLARSTYEQVASPQGWEAVYQALYNPRGFTKYNTALAAYLAGRELQQ